MTPLKPGDKAVVFAEVKPGEWLDFTRVPNAVGIPFYRAVFGLKPDPTPILEALVKVLESNVEDAKAEVLTLADSPSWTDREIAASAQATVEAGTAAIARARAWLEGK